MLGYRLWLDALKSGQHYFAASFPVVWAPPFFSFSFLSFSSWLSSLPLFPFPSLLSLAELDLLPFAGPELLSLGVADGPLG